MAARALVMLGLLALAAFAAGEDAVEAALHADDACLANGGEECSVELRQLRGELNTEVEEEALQGDEEDEDEDEDAEDAEVEDEDAAEEDLDDMAKGKSCMTDMDNKVFKSTGGKGFNRALNNCGRSCAGGFPCTKSCMHKRGYSWGCSICSAKLVECGRDHCINQCISDSFSQACQHCNKAHCRSTMKACSGRALGGS